MTHLKLRHSRRTRVHTGMGARFLLHPGFQTACRRREGRADPVCQCKQLRAFTSDYERVRARQVAFSRVWSRLVAFSRANFFSCSGTFGHVRACSVVIFRHSSSQIFFSGMAGNGRLRHWQGREGSSLLRMVPAPGAGCASCHDIRFKLVCNCGRAAAAFVRVANNCTTVLRSLQFLVFPRVHPRLLCVK